MDNRFLEAYRAIEAYDTIVIHRHTKPDGDALGSQFGLKGILEENFPDKRIYAVGDDPGRFSFLVDEEMDEIPDEVFSSALSIILDTSSSNLISDQRFTAAKETLRFDHHLFLEKICNIEVIDTSSESCAGVIVDFVREMGLKIGSKAAEKLYTAMVTDSGRFLYSSVSASTHDRASFLLSFPFDRSRIYRNLYSEDLENVRMRGLFMSRIKVTRNNVAYVYSSREDVAKMGLSPFSISRGMVNTMANINGVKIWVNFTEDGENVLAELRSYGIDINPIAVAYGGGGHKAASGATLKSKSEALSMLEDLDRLSGEER